MAQTLAQYDTAIRGPQGRLYDAKACGRQRDGRLWEGWIEFEDRETGDTLRTGCETTQPNLVDLEYWATGLTTVYLEGALHRVLKASPPTRANPASPPVFDGPAERPKRKQFTGGDAILDPFSVYKKSPEVLAQELSALHARHLRRIITEYRLADSDVPLEGMTEPELGSLIMQRVRERHA